MADLLTSPLHERHLERGAKLAAFGGWSMPVEFAGLGVLKEHSAVREAAGLFDVSHLGKVTVRGPGTAAFVNRALTNDVDRLAPGQAQYTLCCDDASGGVVDDLIAYRRADDDVLLIPNAANAAEVARRLAEAAPHGVSVEDRHRDFAVLAVQGPRSADVLAAAGIRADLDYMAFVDGPFAHGALTVCRTGYTGEHGYELVVESAGASALWDLLLAAGGAAGLVPAGLGARDTLRTEMGYPLHGQDISLDVTPVQARLGWAVGWRKGEFWGRRVLSDERASGPAEVVRGVLATGRGIPRPGMRVLVHDEAVGVVTSGTFGPTLRRGLGLAMLSADVAVGAQVEVEMRGRLEPFTVTTPPFVPAHTR